MAIVLFSSAQQRFTKGEDRVEIEATRVDHLIRALYARYAELDGQLENAAVAVEPKPAEDPTRMPAEGQQTKDWRLGMSGPSSNQDIFDVRKIRRLVELMKEHDVEHIFGYPGGAILPVFDAIYDAETFDFILTRASAARQMVVCRR